MAVKCLISFLSFALVFTIFAVLFVKTSANMFAWAAFVSFVGLFITMIITVGAVMDEYINK